MIRASQQPSERIVRPLSGEEGRDGDVEDRPFQNDPHFRQRISSLGTEWKALFIEALRITGNVAQSCTAAGVQRKTVMRAREKSVEFARAWDEALEDSTDDLLRVARERAIARSDQLLMFLLKAARPETFREKSPLDLKSEDLNVAIERQLAQLASRYPGTVSTASPHLDPDV